MIYGTATNADVEQLNERVADINQQSLKIITNLDQMIVYINISREFTHSLAIRLHELQLINQEAQLHYQLSSLRQTFYLQIIGLYLEMSKLNEIVTSINNKQLSHQLISPKRLLAILKKLEKHELNTNGIKLNFPLNEENMHNIYISPPL
jgi:hypothetical protein